jgi:hypothetical protein
VKKRGGGITPMAIAATRMDVSGIFKTLPGRLLSRAVLNVTGLVAGSSNTVPHGLPRPPETVHINNWGPSAAAGQAVLDSTQGYADAGGNRMGFDSANVYIVTTAGTTTAQLNVKFGRV